MSRADGEIKRTEEGWYARLGTVTCQTRHLQLHLVDLHQPSKYKHHDVKWPTGARNTLRRLLPATDVKIHTNHASMPVRLWLPFSLPD